MRPIRLEFQAFGPYKGKEVVDFEQLSSQGLFLICGETGSGKTMILDAITYALYGKSSGNLREKMDSLRCRQSEWGVDTYVKFEFETDHQIYCFERRLECKRKNLSEKQNAFVKNDKGVFEPLFENCRKDDMDKKAQELIGLDYNQFRQVIILPQGQFEKLLTANSDEKEKVLVSIFGVDKWQEIAGCFYARVENKRKELTRAKEKIDHKLEEEECSSVEEFAGQIRELEQELKQIKEQYETENQEEKLKELQKEKEVWQQFDELHKLEQKVKELEDRQEDISCREERLIAAKKADKLKPVIDRVLMAEQERKKRETELGRQQDALKAAELRENEAKKTWEELDKQKDEMEKQKTRVGIYKEKRSYYESLEELQANLKKAEKELKTAEKNQEKARLAEEREKEILGEVSKRYISLDKEHRELLERYLTNIAGSLAEKLEEGEPCPVCGSTVHPNPAQLERGDVSKEMVDQKKELADEVYLELQKQQQKLEEVAADVAEKQKEAGQKKSAAELAQKEVDIARRQLLEGINTSRELEEKIRDTAEKIENYEKALETAQMDWRGKTEKLASVRTALEQAGLELKNSETEHRRCGEELEKSLENSGFGDVASARDAMLSSQDLEHIQTEISDYKSDRKNYTNQCKEKKDELAHVREPDIESCNQQIQDITERKERYLQLCAGKEQELSRKKKKQKEIGKIAERIEAEWNQVESDSAFAKSLRGDTGIGLQRYVLGILFSSVIVAANKMLEKVHGGRYRLYRTDEKAQGSNKKGLELYVHDSFDLSGGEGRSVKTLSGGEKFLVSLALSIGLSTIAQHSGVRLEAMFIDEGFGSLDQNSIEDAMDVLLGIQRANGMVGIISHVQVLKDNIPAKLEIIKSREGSRIRHIVG